MSIGQLTVWSRSVPQDFDQPGFVQSDFVQSSLAAEVSPRHIKQGFTTMVSGAGNGQKSHVEARFAAHFRRTQRLGFHIAHKNGNGVSQ
jgi:hypothetical protein